MDYGKLGQRIKDERTRFKLTQEKLAELVDLSTVYIGQIERGERKMSLDTLIKISDCLHVSLDYLVKGAGKMPDSEAVNELQTLIYKCSPDEISLVTDMVKVVLPHVKG